VQAAPDRHVVDAEQLHQVADANAAASPHLLEDALLALRGERVHGRSRTTATPPAVNAMLPSTSLPDRRSVPEALTVTSLSRWLSRNNHDVPSAATRRTASSPGGASTT